MKRFVKTRIKTWLHLLFEVGQKFGFHVLPRHFYTKIPDLNYLKSTRRWRKEYSMLGVRGAELDSQLEWLKVLLPPAMTLRLQKGDVHSAACRDNGEAGYGPIEAEVLHGFIHHYQPARIIQIGCGVSTELCIRAAAEARYELKIFCVEPYPTDYLKRLAAESKIVLLPKKTPGCRL